MARSVIWDLTSRVKLKPGSHDSINIRAKQRNEVKPAT